MATRPLNGSLPTIPTPQGQFLVFPSLPVPSDASPLPPPSLPGVQAIGPRPLHQRVAFAPLHNSLGLPPVATPFSSFVRAKIEEGIAVHALASIADRRAENTLSSSRVAIAPPPSRDIPYIGSFVFAPPTLTFVQDGNPPQPIPAAAQLQPTRRKRKNLDWRDETPAAYRAAPKAEAETKAQPQPLPVVNPALPASLTLPKGEQKVDPDSKNAGAEQQLPELRPVPTPARKVRFNKEPEAGFLDFKGALTPDNYQATIGANRRYGSFTYYERSNDSIDSSLSIFEAADRIEKKQYQAAVTALYQALFFLHGKKGFVYLLLLDIAAVMHANADPRLTSSAPEEDLDVLILRGIYQINHGNFESAIALWQQVLTQRPNGHLENILLAHATYLRERPPEVTHHHPQPAAAVTYDSVSSAFGSVTNHNEVQLG